MTKDKTSGCSDKKRDGFGDCGFWRFHEATKKGSDSAMGSEMKKRTCIELAEEDFGECQYLAGLIVGLDGSLAAEVLDSSSESCPEATGLFEETTIFEKSAGAGPSLRRVVRALVAALQSARRVAACLRASTGVFAAPKAQSARSF